MNDRFLEKHKGSPTFVFCVGRPFRQFRDFPINWDICDKIGNFSDVFFVLIFFFVLTLAIIVHVFKDAHHDGRCRRHTTHCPWVWKGDWPSK